MDTLVPTAPTRFSGMSTSGGLLEVLSESVAVSRCWGARPKYLGYQGCSVSSKRSEMFGWGCSWRQLAVDSRGRGSVLMSKDLLSVSATFVAEVPIDLPWRPAIDLFSTEAEARLVAVVGSGAGLSPFNGASWREVMDQMARKLVRADRGLEMVVFEDGQLFSQGLGGDCCRAAFRKADILVIVRVEETASVKYLVDESSQTRTVVAFDSHPDAMAQCRLGGVPVGPDRSRPQPQDTPFPWNKSKTHAAVKKMRYVTDIWNRVSSDNIVFALQLLINTYVTPVKSMHQLRATGIKPLARMIWHCGPQLLAVFIDPQARKALIDMLDCDPADQFASYRCIVEAESPVLAEFSLRALQQHNCLDLCAKLPMHLAVPPLCSFRGQPMTHLLAQNLLIGWVQKLGWSWKIVGSMFAIANLFSCQHQIFYREPANDCMWYDPVFRGTSSQDGTPFWRRRHYNVETADRPGSFFFTVLDNGVVTREFWTIVDMADDLSWGLFYYFGAAERAGQTFTGAVVVTPDGLWPSDSQSDRLNLVLEKCGIKPWEIVKIDHFFTGEPPQLGPPEHVPAQECLVESWQCQTVAMADSPSCFPRLPIGTALQESTVNLF